MLLMNPLVAYAGFLFVGLGNIFYAGEIGLGTFLLQKNWLYSNKMQVYFKNILHNHPLSVLIWLKDFFYDSSLGQAMDAINN